MRVSPRPGLFHQLREPECMGQNRTVLVVDDTEQVLKLVARILRDSGFSVLTAGNAVDALIIFNQQKENIHLLLADIRMPGPTGIELAVQVQQKKPDTKIMLMSALDESALVQDERWQFLAKPFLPAQLLEAVQALLNTSKQAGVLERDNASNGPGPDGSGVAMVPSNLVGGNVGK